MRIYTRKGDDGTTALLYGGRVAKTAPVVAANGAVDETQAAIGAARAEVGRGSELDTLLVGLERDLYVLMAEVATPPDKRDRLVAGTTEVTAEMVAALETAIDQVTERFPPVRFVLPGQNRVSALLDVARATARRAERAVVEACQGDAWSGSHVGAYINRLSDLLWTLARWQEQGTSLPARRPARPEPPTKDKS